MTCLKRIEPYCKLSIKSTNSSLPLAHHPQSGLTIRFGRRMPWPMTTDHANLKTCNLRNNCSHKLGSLNRRDLPALQRPVTRIEVRAPS